MDRWKFLGTSRFAENTLGEPLYFYLQKLMNSMTFVYISTTTFIRLSSYQIVFVMREPGRRSAGYV